MGNRKPTAGFWMTVAVVALLSYPLSFGPACWFGERNGIGTSTIATVYQPILWLASSNTGLVARAVLWYAALGASSRAEPFVSQGGELRWLYFPAYPKPRPARGSAPPSRGGTSGAPSDRLLGPR